MNAYEYGDVTQMEFIQDVGSQYCITSDHYNYRHKFLKVPKEQLIKVIEAFFAVHS